jgi:putative membrane protein
MIVGLACLAALLAYGAALWRGSRGHHGRRAIPPLRPAAFAAGVAAVWAALGPALDPPAHVRFSFHMVQHLLLTLVAPPLLLAGTPVVVARRAVPPALRRAIGAAGRTRAARALLFPAVTWAALPAVLWLSHYTPLYEAALESPAVHILEHGLYLAAGLVFWFPVVALEPGPWPMPYPLRLLYLFLAVPQNAFLALSLYQANRVLYPDYGIVARAARIDPLADQQSGAVVMWIAGGLLLFAAMLAVAGAWARADALAARRADRRPPEDAAAAAAAAADGGEATARGAAPGPAQTRPPGAAAVSRIKPMLANTTIPKPGMSSHKP